MMWSTGLLTFIGFALRFLSVLLVASVKVSVILAFVFAVSSVMKNAHPRLRHVLWLAAIGSSLCVLFLSVNGPLFLFAGANEPQSRDVMYQAASAALLPSSGVFVSPDSAISVARGIGIPTAATRSWLDLWPAAVLSLWAAGAATGFLRISIGRIQLSRLTRGATRSHTRRLSKYAASLSHCVGISREVRVLESAACSVPFTWGVFRPFIVLPSSMRGWPRDSIRAVLLHELRHIRRGDSLTLAIAYAACSLFWFLPFIWAAYTRLYLEQEKSCDSAVIEDGEDRYAYATCVLDAVRSCREAPAFAGLSLSGRRRKVLKDRIHFIIGGGKAMKKGLVLFALAALLVGALVVLSAAGKKESMTDKEVWSKVVGEWTNTTYRGSMNSGVQKVVIRADFVVEDWLTVTSVEPEGWSKVKLKKWWTDRQGYIYCQFHDEHVDPIWSKVYPNSNGLIRLDKTGKIIEFTYLVPADENEKYPEEVGLGTSHFVYYK